MELDQFPVMDSPPETSISPGQMRDLRFLTKHFPSPQSHSGAPSTPRSNVKPEDSDLTAVNSEEPEIIYGTAKVSVFRRGSPKVGDSGYHSSSFRSPPKDFQTLYDPISKRPELYIYHGPMLKDFKDKFRDFWICFEPALLQVIRRKRKNRDFADTSLKLKWVGETMESIVPDLLFYGHEELFKTVRVFFKRQDVKDALWANAKVYMRKKRIEPLFAEEDEYDEQLRVFSEPRPLLTYCGTKINMESEGGILVAATLGGLVMGTRHSERTILGLTSGHQLKSIQKCYTDAYSEDEDPHTDSEDEEPSDSEGDPVALQEDGERDTIPYDENLGETADEAYSDNRMFDDFDDEIGGMMPDTDMGTIFSHSYQNSGSSAGNFDWALVNLNSGDYLPNFLVSRNPDSVEPKRAVNYDEQLRPDDVSLVAVDSLGAMMEEEKMVSVITNRGAQEGVLSSGTSCIMSSGNKFIDTLDLVLSSESELIPGDSGSWVVDEKTLQVYGHVTSIDELGEAYVIPIQDTLSDIKGCLKFTEIKLPTKSEVEVHMKGGTQPPTGDKCGKEASKEPLPRIEEGFIPEREDIAYPPNNIQSRTCSNGENMSVNNSPLDSAYGSSGVGRGTAYASSNTSFDTGYGSLVVNPSTSPKLSGWRPSMPVCADLGESDLDDELGPENEIGRRME